MKMSDQYITKAKLWKNRNIAYERSSLVRYSKCLLLHWMPVIALLLIVVLQMDVSIPVVAQMQRTSTISKSTSTSSRTVSKTNTKKTAASSKLCYMCAGDANAFITKPESKVSIVSSISCGQLYSNVGNQLYLSDCLRVSINPTLQKLCGCSNVVAKNPKVTTGSTDSLNVIRTTDTTGSTDVTPVVIDGQRKVTIGPTITYAPTVTFSPTRPPSVSPGPTITENPTNTKTLIPTIRVATIEPTRLIVGTFFPTSSRLPTITPIPLPTTNFPTVLAVTDEPTRLVVGTYFPTSSRLPTMTPLPTTNFPTEFAVTDEPTPQIFFQPQTWFPTTSPIPTASRLPTITAQPTTEMAGINTVKPIYGSPSMTMAPKKMLRMRMMKKLKMGSMMSSPGSSDDDEWSSHKMMMGKSDKRKGDKKQKGGKKDSNKIRTNPNRIMYKTMKMRAPNPTTSPLVVRTDTGKNIQYPIKRTTNGELHTTPTISRTMQSPTKKRSIINMQSLQKTKTPVRIPIILVQPVLVQSRQVTPAITQPLFVKNNDPTTTISRRKAPIQELVPIPIENPRTKPVIIVVAAPPIPVQSREVPPTTNIEPYNSPTTKPIVVMQPIVVQSREATPPTTIEQHNSPTTKPIVAMQPIVVQSRGATPPTTIEQHNSPTTKPIVGMQPTVQSREVSPPTTIEPYNSPTTKPIVVMQPTPVQSHQVSPPISTIPSFNVRSTTTLFQSKSSIKVNNIVITSATTSRNKPLTMKPKPASGQSTTAHSSPTKIKPTAPSLSSISAVLFQSSPSATTLSHPTGTMSRIQRH